MTERIEVVCLNCGKRWMGKANAKRWKCTQCGSTRVRKLEDVKELLEKDVTQNLEVDEPTEIQETENVDEVHVNSHVKNVEIPRENVEQSGVKSEVQSEKEDSQGGKIITWLLLIPLLIMAAYFFISSFFNKEEKEPEESEKPTPFGRRLL